jgi:hypothetical protein
MSNRYTIVESVGSTTQSVTSFDDLEKHHPSSGQEAGRDYETIDGDFEEIRKTADGRTLIKKDFVLLVNGSNTSVPVPCPVSGYVKTKTAYGTVSIYDSPGGKLLGQVLHLNTAFKVKDGDFVEYGQAVGIQSGTGAAGTVSYAIHAHVELEKSQFVKYIADIVSGAITPSTGASVSSSGNEPPFQFPIRKADGSHYRLEELYKELEKETSGHYLLGNHGFWHGGIHFSERSVPHCMAKQAIRCMADGEVVAYRLNKDYLASNFQGKTECTKLRYSTSFCLVRHTYESTKRPPEKKEKPKIEWPGRVVRLSSSRNARDVAGKNLGKSGNFEALMPAETELQIITVQEAAVDGYRFANAKILKGQLSGTDREGKPATCSVGQAIWFAAFDKSGNIVKANDKSPIFKDITPLPPPEVKPQPEAQKPETNKLTFFSLYMHLLPFEQFPVRDSEDKRRVRVKASGLNVRQEANLTAAPLGHIDSGAELEVISTTPGYRKQPGDTTTYELAQVKILSKAVKKAGKQTAKVGDTVWLALSKTDAGKAPELYAADIPKQKLTRPAYWKGNVSARVTRRLSAFKSPQDEEAKRMGQLAENSVLEYHTDSLKRVMRNGQPQIMAECTIVSGGFWDKTFCPASPVWVVIDKSSTALNPEAPTDFDTVVTCSTPIKAGDPIGYLGLYETPASVKGGKNSLHQVHVETFTADPNLEIFLKNPAGLKDGPQFFRVAKGKPIYNKSGPDTETIFTANGLFVSSNYVIQPNQTRLVKGTDNKAWYAIKVNTATTPVDGYIAKADGETICQHDREKLGFEIIKENNGNTDGFLDPQAIPDFYQSLYLKIDELGNKDGKVSSDELSLALKNAKLRDRWAKLIAYHPTEWQAKSDDTKWQALNTMLKDAPEVLRHEKERIDNLVFWDELAGAMEMALPKQVHHFHPLALMDSLNIGEVVESEHMYLARTIYGEARGQNYASKMAVAWIIRNRLAKGTWGSTYRSVVTARLQFTCWSKKHDPHGYEAIHNPVGTPWEDCQKAAHEVMNAPASANVLPDALNYYSPTAQTQLHAQKPDVYPATPPFAISTKRVPNPPGVSDADYRFYKN